MSLGRLRVIAVAVSGLLLGGLLAIATPYYQTDDDAAMHLRAAGVVLTSEPSEFLLFMHPVIGWLLSTLYRWLPDWPWYPLHHLFAHLCIAGACGWLALRRWGTPGLLAAAGFIVVVQTYFIWNLQFTTVAMLLGVVGILLLRFGESRVEWVLGAFMLLWAPLIRYEAFQACAAVAVILAAADAWTRPFPRRWIWILAGTGVLFVVVPVSFRAYYAAHSEWAAFLEQNALKGLFTDSRVVTTYTIPPDAYAASGLTPADVQCYQEWMFDESDGLTRENVEPLLSAVNPAQIGLDDFRSRLQRLGVVTLRSPGSWMLLCGLLLWPMFRLRPRGGRRAAAALLGTAGLLAWLLLKDGRVQDHVVSPLLVSALVICLFELESTRHWVRRRGARRLLAVALFCIVGGTAVLHVHRCWVWHEERAAEEHQALAVLDEIRTLPGLTLADLAGAFPFGKPAAFRNPHQTFAGTSLLLGATHAITPDYRQQRERLGIERLYPELIGNTRLIIWHPARLQALAYQNLLNQKYGRDVAFERVLRHKGRDLAYRVIPAEAANPRPGRSRGFLPDGLLPDR